MIHRDSYLILTVNLLFLLLISPITSQPGILRVIVSQTGLISGSVKRPDLFSNIAAKRKPDEIIFLEVRHVLLSFPEMRPFVRTK